MITTWARDLLSRLRRPTLQAARLTSRLQRATSYGLDLLLWSRLFAARRGPVPLELPPSLLAEKGLELPPPMLHRSAPGAHAIAWEEGFASVNATLFLNLQNPDLLSSLRYAHPAPSFRGVYLWDSAFIAQIWKWWDLPTAVEILRAVIALRQGGRLQHVVSDLVSSPFTQPPLIAWSLVAVHRAADDATRKRLPMVEAESALRDFNRWLQRNRCNRLGLYFWRHPYESGVENASRFCPRDERHFVDTRRLSSPDCCAYVILQTEALADLARLRGDECAAGSYQADAQALRERVNEWLWCEEDGFYYDRDNASGDFVRVRAVTGLLTLWAGIPDRERARRLLRQIMDPAAFNTAMPLPSVARNDPHFEFDMWRGPVWLNTAYGVIRGLERYGFEAEAAELSWRLCEGVYGTHALSRRLYEFYDPERRDVCRLDRKRGNRWKRFTLGGEPCREFVGWTGLVNVLVIEHLLGLHRDRHARLRLRPRMPAAAAGEGFSLRLPAAGIALQLAVCDRRGDIEGHVFRDHGGSRRFHCRFGDSLKL